MVHNPPEGARGRAPRSWARARRNARAEESQLVSAEQTCKRLISSKSHWIRKVQLHRLSVVGATSSAGAMPFRNLNRSLSVERTSVVFSPIMDL